MQFYRIQKLTGTLLLAGVGVWILIQHSPTDLDSDSINNTSISNLKQSITTSPRSTHEADQPSADTVSKSSSLRNRSELDSSIPADSPGTLSSADPEISTPSQEPPIVWLDPSAPGNHFTEFQQTIEIQSYQFAASTQFPEFAVSVTPATNSPPASPSITQTTPTAAASKNSPRSNQAASETELFRAKWGWAAYAQLQKIAQETSREAP